MDGNRIVEENNGEKDEGGRGGRGGWGREDGGAEKDGEGGSSHCHPSSSFITHLPEKLIF